VEQAESRLSTAQTIFRGEITACHAERTPPPQDTNPALISSSTGRQSWTIAWKESWAVPVRWHPGDCSMAPSLRSL